MPPRLSYTDFYYPYQIQNVPKKMGSIIVDIDLMVHVVPVAMAIVDQQMGATVAHACS